MSCLPSIGGVDLGGGEAAKVGPWSDAGFIGAHRTAPGPTLLCGSSAELDIRRGNWLWATVVVTWIPRLAKCGGRDHARPRHCNALSTGSPTNGGGGGPQKSSSHQFRHESRAGPETKSERERGRDKISARVLSPCDTAFVLVHSSLGHQDDSIVRRGLVRGGQFWSFCWSRAPLSRAFLLAPTPLFRR